MANWFERFKVQARRNHLLTYGLPFMAVVVLGPFWLRHFGEIRYKYRKVTQVPEEKMKEFGYKPSDQLSLEDEYKKIKEMDIDTWEQVRGPRPWEESFEEEKK